MLPLLFYYCTSLQETSRNGFQKCQKHCRTSSTCGQSSRTSKIKRMGMFSSTADAIITKTLLVTSSLFGCSYPACRLASEYIQGRASVAEVVKNIVPLKPLTTIEYVHDTTRDTVVRKVPFYITLRDDVQDSVYPCGIPRLDQQNHMDTFDLCNTNSDVRHKTRFLVVRTHPCPHHIESK